MNSKRRAENSCTTLYDGVMEFLAGPKGRAQMKVPSSTVRRWPRKTGQTSAQASTGLLPRYLRSHLQRAMGKRSSSQIKLFVLCVFGSGQDKLKDFPVHFVKEARTQSWTFLKQKTEDVKSIHYHLSCKAAPTLRGIHERGHVRLHEHSKRVASHACRAWPSSCSNTVRSGSQHTPAVHLHRLSHLKEKSQHHQINNNEFQDGCIRGCRPGNCSSRGGLAKELTSDEKAGGVSCQS